MVPPLQKPYFQQRMMSRAAAREIENLAPSLYSTAMTSMPALRLKGCGVMLYGRIWTDRVAP